MKHSAEPTGITEADGIGPRHLVKRLSGPDRPRFSLCTMVTKWHEYRVSAETFVRGGFDHTCSEYLVVDNVRRNTADAYVALNEFLQVARGDYVVLCHQDVKLIEHGRTELEKCLADLTAADPHWGVCGNAGFREDGSYSTYISHPHCDVDVQGGPFPAQMSTLDENFLVVRREANLAVSRDLSGFHHYGTDLCLIAEVLGWTSYVIAFFLRHNSSGTVDRSFMVSRQMIARKYSLAFHSRWVWVMAGHPFYVSGSVVRSVAIRAWRRARVALRRYPQARARLE